MLITLATLRHLTAMYRLRAVSRNFLGGLEEKIMQKERTLYREWNMPSVPWFAVHLGLLSSSPQNATIVKYVFLNLVFRAQFLNPFTPESDQNSPAASQEIWHHTVWRTWLFIAYSDEKWLYYKFSLHHSYNRLLKGWENTLFELRSERVKAQLV